MASRQSFRAQGSSAWLKLMLRATPLRSRGDLLSRPHCFDSSLGQPLQLSRSHLGCWQQFDLELTKNIKLLENANVSIRYAKVFLRNLLYETQFISTRWR
eukprot:6376521-Amphidinium_carterae.1